MANAATIPETITIAHPDPVVRAINVSVLANATPTMTGRKGPVGLTRIR
jgi:hypothetical protein